MLNVPEAMVRLEDFDEAWTESSPGARLNKVRFAAERLHDRFASGPRVIAVRTLPLTTLPYPTKYAFQSAASSLLPFVQLTHRCALVQFFQNGIKKNLLFNPTDIEAARATPYYAQLAEQLGALAKFAVKKNISLEHQLAEIGLFPADIDYLAFDHFHTQDLRSLLGKEGGAAPRFPNATLLAPKKEWDEWENLHPIQRAWFIQDGRKSVRMTNVLLTDADLQLGDGLMLLRTPGHTIGHQTLVMHTEKGVWGIGENGTSADNWSPLNSRIQGVASTARALDLDVVMNSNTAEDGGNQYTSMVLEKTLVNRVKTAPAFVQMFPSSEITPSALAPISPTWRHGEINVGVVVRTDKTRASHRSRAGENHPITENRNDH